MREVVTEREENLIPGKKRSSTFVLIQYLFFFVLVIERFSVSELFLQRMR